MGSNGMRFNMALKIIKTTSALYQPIQDSGTWEKNAIYVSKIKDGYCELYIDGNNCGIYYNDEELRNKVNEIQSYINSIQEDRNFIYIQNVASATWNIIHNLNKMPSVTIVDSAGNVVIGEIKYIDTNELTVAFSGAFSGKAFLN